MDEYMSAEPMVPQPAPQAPSYVERKVPTCPHCDGLVRRTLTATTGRLRERGITGQYSWQCDIHGGVEPKWETWEIPTGDDDAA